MGCSGNWGRPGLPGISRRAGLYEGHQGLNATPVDGGCLFRWGQVTWLALA